MMIAIDVLIVLDECDNDATQDSDQYTKIHNIHRGLDDILSILNFLIARLKARLDNMKSSVDDQV